ncbi:unknown [Parabacteroides sp. CAG:409]|nr:unknown [Parabacteroides sp. CAG:409]
MIGQQSASLDVSITIMMNAILWNLMDAMMVLDVIQETNVGGSSHQDLQLGI